MPVCTASVLDGTGLFGVDETHLLEELVLHGTESNRKTGGCLLHLVLEMTDERGAAVCGEGGGRGTAAA